jgi:thioredoxin-like negative regulator of GroEL
VVDSFVGVLPAEPLRQFVGRLLPDPAETQRRKAAELLKGGDAAGAAREAAGRTAVPLLQAGMREA